MAILKDERVDKIVGWCLALAVVLMLGYVGTSLKDLSNKIDSINSRLIILESASFKERIDKIEARIRELELNEARRKQ